MSSAMKIVCCEVVRFYRATFAISLKTDYLRQTARRNRGTAKQADTIDGREPILYTGGALKIAHPGTPA